MTGQPRYRPSTRRATLRINHDTLADILDLPKDVAIVSITTINPGASTITLESPNYPELHPNQEPLLQDLDYLRANVVFTHDCC